MGDMTWIHILPVFAPAEQLTSGSCGCAGKKPENKHHKYIGGISVVLWVLCTDLLSTTLRPDTTFCTADP